MPSFVCFRGTILNWGTGARLYPAQGATESYESYGADLCSCQLIQG